MRAIDGFLTLAGDALAGQAHPAARRVARLLAEAPTSAEPLAPQRVAGCSHLPAAIAAMRPALAAAFAALEPELAWQVRPVAGAGPGFAEGYAGARVLGPQGLEQRGGMVAGFSLVAPGLTYPDHSHPPEEVYLALSGGAWWNAETPWHEPGVGGIVHNPPGILHAMRGTDVPLLAIWFLLPS